MIWRRIAVLLAFPCIALVAATLTPIMAHCLIDCTEYAPGYSEARFQEIVAGMSEFEVKQLLGEPLRVSEGWPGVYRYYGPAGSTIGPDGGIHSPSGDFSSCRIIRFNLSGEIAEGGCQPDWIGKTEHEVNELLGKPIETRVRQATRFFCYTRPQPKGDYYVRNVGFDESGIVVEKVASWYWD